MAYSDLQDYLAALERSKKLHWIDKEVDPTWEIAAVTRTVFERFGWTNRPALGFRRVRGSEIPLVVGVCGGSPSIYAIALNSTLENIGNLWEQAQKLPIPPILTPTGFCKELICSGSRVDLGILPQVVWTPSLDPGPYITAGLVITKDLFTGIRNVGTYRLQIKGPQHLGIYVGNSQHGARHIRQHENEKRQMPVAIAIGMDPAVVLASINKFPYGTDELSIAGGLRQDPLPIVHCETVDLEVPANSEIVIEGFIRWDQKEPEGPFGEFHGYMSPGVVTPRIDVTCITRRKKPVMHAFLSQMPPSESSCIRSISRSAALLHHLRNVLGQPVRDVHFPESGGSSSIIVISMKKESDEQVKEVAFGAWSLMNKEGKFTIVVDDDIDVRNPFQVEWAMSFHAQPARDFLTIDGLSPSGLDPSTASSDVPTHDKKRRSGSKIIIDATRKHHYPPPARVPNEHMDTVLKNWMSYGFSEPKQ